MISYKLKSTSSTLAKILITSDNALGIIIASPMSQNAEFYAIDLKDMKSVEKLIIESNIPYRSGQDDACLCESSNGDLAEAEVRIVSLDQCSRYSFKINRREMLSKATSKASARHPIL